MALRFFLNIGTSWNDTSNWSASSGGAGGAGVPTSSDIATFDANSGNCNTDVNSNTSGIDLKAAYPNTLTQDTTRTITLGSAGFVQAGGTFSGGDSDISIAIGNFTLSGGTFTNTSATFTIERGAWDTSTGTYTYNHNNGLVYFKGFITTDYAISVSTETYYNVRIYGGDNSGWTLTGVMSVENNLNLGQINWSSGYLNGGTVELKGNLTMDNDGFEGGTSTIRLIGTTDQTMETISGSTGRFPSIEINKASGDIIFGDDVILNESWTWVAADGLNQAGFALRLVTEFSGSSLVKSTFTAGGISYGSVSLLHRERGGIRIVGALTINGTSTFGQFSGKNGELSGGSISSKGDIILNGSSKSFGGSTNYTIDGASNQNISGLGQFPLSLVTVAKPSGKLILLNTMSPISANHDFDNNSGDIDLNGFGLTLEDRFFNSGIVSDSIGGSTLTYGRGSFIGGSISLENMISSTTQTGIIFSDASGFTLSVTNFTFNGANHFDLIQNYSKFTNVIIDKCLTCNAKLIMDIDGNITFISFKNFLESTVIVLRGDLLGASADGGISTSAVIMIEGSNNQNYGATGTMPSIIVNKSGGTLTQTDNIKISGYIVHQNGLTDFLTNQKTTTLKTGNNGYSLNTGLIIFYDLIVDKAGGSKYVLQSALRIKNEFTINSWAGSMDFTGDPIIVGGDVLMGTTTYQGNSEMQLSGAGQDFTPATTWNNTGQVSLVEIGAESDFSNIIIDKLLREDGGFMLREDGGKILREGL